jgi:beta-xylosidase
MPGPRSLRLGSAGLLLASCAGGAEVWTETPAGAPVLDRGPEGAWDHYAVDNPFVLVDGGVAYCFYEGQDKPFDRGGRERIGLAVSRDGLRWEKWAGNPVLDVGPPGAWDSRVAKLPVVTRHGDLYYLFYSGRDASTKNIGLATSPDLRHWTKHGGNPVLRGRPEAWDRQLSTHPAPVVRRGGRFYLLYRGMTSLYRQQGLGVAVSDDLLRWARVQESPVIPAEEEVASLAVAPMDGGFWGVAQSPGRPVWVSNDLLQWDRRGAAGFSGPAVDTVSNPVRFGGDWVVLYEQKDRIYRAVRR